MATVVYLCLVVHDVCVDGWTGQPSVTATPGRAADLAYHQSA